MRRNFNATNSNKIQQNTFRKTVKEKQEHYLKSVRGSLSIEELQLIDSGQLLKSLNKLSSAEAKHNQLKMHSNKKMEYLHDIRSKIRKEQQKYVPFNKYLKNNKNYQYKIKYKPPLPKLNNCIDKKILSKSILQTTNIYKNQTQPCQSGRRKPSPWIVDKNKDYQDLYYYKLSFKNYQNYSHQIKF